MSVSFPNVFRITNQGLSRDLTELTHPFNLLAEETRFDISTETREKDGGTDSRCECCAGNKKKCELTSNNM